MRSTRHLIRLASLLSVVFVLSFAGCAGYQYGSESLFRQGVRTVHVPIVRNETFRHDLGVRLTEAIVKEVERTHAIQSRQRSGRRQHSPLHRFQSSQTRVDRDGKR